MIDALIVANLDCEAEWAGAPALAADVRAKIAGLGTLLRVLGDHPIELPAAVDPARVPGEVDLRVRGHGEAAARVIAWGATAAWPDSGDVEVARKASDRRLAARLADDGVARVVASIAALEARLPEVVEASPDRAWVAKATICAAGRDRIRRQGATLDDVTRARLGRLLARGGALILEPWLLRVHEYGQPGRIDDGGVVRLAPPHRLHSSADGGFRGIGVDDDLHPSTVALLAAAGRKAGEALAALGHRGPFGIDAMEHVDGFRAIGEINPRLSFGVIARAWAERLGVRGTFSIGRGAPPDGAIPLLLPGPGDATCAWFTASGR